jgi:hypothetical protein
MDGSYPRRRLAFPGSRVSAGELEDMITEADARAVQATLERGDGDPKPGGRLGRAQLLDVSQQDDLSMERLELGERRRQLLDTASGRDEVGRIDDLRRAVVSRAALPRRKPPLPIEEPETLATDDREQPARDRRRRAPERLDGSSGRPERLLDRILGILGGPTYVEAVPVHTLAVQHHQAVKCPRIASLRSGQEVIRRMHARGHDG